MRKGRQGVRRPWSRCWCAPAPRARHAAADQAHVEYKDAFTTTQPGAPAGRKNRNDYSAAADPNGKSRR